MDLNNDFLLRTIKRSGKIFILCLIIITFTSPGFALNINLYGRSGAVIRDDGSVKICPGLTFHKCATVHITWDDVRDWLSNRSPFAGTVTEEESGQTYHVDIVVEDEHLFDDLTSDAYQIDVSEDNAIRFYYIQQ